MRLKLIVATLVALAGFDIADPPNVLTETVCMTQQQPAIGVPAVRTAPPKTRQVEVSLDDIVVDLERYCHRDKKSLEPEAYEPLKNSILQEGLRHPIEVFRRPDGTYGVVTGHRRYYVV